MNTGPGEWFTLRWESFGVQVGFELFFEQRGQGWRGTHQEDYSTLLKHQKQNSNCLIYEQNYKNPGITRKLLPLWLRKVVLELELVRINRPKMCVLRIFTGQCVY